MLDLLGTIEGFIQGLIHSDGGWKFTDMQSGTVAGGASTTGSHHANTHLDITGSGIFAGFAAMNTDGGTNLISIQIDGGTIYSVQANMVGHNQLFLFTFQSRLIVKSTYAPSLYKFAYALVGDTNEADLTKYTPVSSYTPSAAHLANTLVDITGKGMLTDVGVQQSGYEIRICVDGNKWFPGHTNMEASIYVTPSTSGQIAPTLIPFQTSLKVTTGATVGQSWCNFKLS